MLKLVLFVYATVTIVWARSAINKYNKLSTEDKEPVHHTTESIEKDTDIDPSHQQSYWSDLSTIYRTYSECSERDLSVCLKIKLIRALDGASKSIHDVKLFDYIQFVKDPDDTTKRDFSKEEPALSENEIIANLPRSIEAKELTLTSMIWEKILKFFQSHTLQLKFPTANEIQRSLDEARKKKKEKGAMIMIPLLLGGTFIPIAYGALALLAGKALIVSKLALVLASIIGIKKLVSSSQGHHESSHEVVVSGGHSGSGWGRDFDLAYNAFAPKDRSPNQIR